MTSLMMSFCFKLALYQPFFYVFILLDPLRYRFRHNVSKNKFAIFDVFEVFIIFYRHDVRRTRHFLTCSDSSHFSFVVFRRTV